MAAVAAGLWLVYGLGFVGYDSVYALIWGRQLSHGQLPDFFEVTGSPTPHPLLNAVTAVLAPLGDRALPALARAVAGGVRRARLGRVPARARAVLGADRDRVRRDPAHARPAGRRRVPGARGDPVPRARDLEHRARGRAAAPRRAGAGAARARRPAAARGLAAVRGLSRLPAAAARLRATRADGRARGRRAASVGLVGPGDHRRSAALAAPHAEGRGAARTPARAATSRWSPGRATCATSSTRPWSGAGSRDASPGSGCCSRARSSRLRCSPSACSASSASGSPTSRC